MAAVKRRRTPTARSLGLEEDQGWSNAPGRSVRSRRAASVSAGDVGCTNGCSGAGSRSLWFTIMEQSIAVVLFYALSLFVLYWVIRLAVRHAIQDADKRRSRGGS